ncbi:MAG TPA: tripartite tricarboxylate transporter substrate-binding protein [Ramlibacter sp.]|nr:tripartite tricarboxylate transporter substrate-binding protein [Ramlibacter sp.]
MKISRRAFTLGTGAALALPALADTYPSRPIRMMIGFAAAGSTDAVARYYAQKMGEVLKTSVIVDNKPGAGQLLAIRSLATAQPDGYTLYLGTGSAFSQGPGVRKDLPYNPLKDFSLIGLMCTAPGVVVISNKLPVKTLRDLVKLSQVEGSNLNYGSSGVGAASHLQTEYLLKLTGMKMTHIPYKADADIMRELTAGTIHLGISTIQGAMGSITSGRVRALAVTGSRRLKVLPDVPTLTESDYKGLEGIHPYSYYGLAGPAGLPAAVVAKLNDAINKVSGMPDAITHLQERLNFDPETGSPERFRKYIQEDMEKWAALGKVVKLTD